MHPQRVENAAVEPSLHCKHTTHGHNRRILQPHANNTFFLLRPRYFYSFDYFFHRETRVENPRFLTNIQIKPHYYIITSPVTGSRWVCSINTAIKFGKKGSQVFVWLQPVPGLSRMILTSIWNVRTETNYW